MSSGILTILSSNLEAVSYFIFGVLKSERLKSNRFYSFTISYLDSVSEEQSLSVTMQTIFKSFFGSHSMLCKLKGSFLARDMSWLPFVIVGFQTLQVLWCPRNSLYLALFVLFLQQYLMWELNEYWGNNNNVELFRLMPGVWYLSNLGSNPCSAFVFNYGSLGFNYVGEIVVWF